MGLVLRENHTEAGRFFDRSRAFFCQNQRNIFGNYCKTTGDYSKKNQKTWKMSSANVDIYTSIGKKTKEDFHKYIEIQLNHRENYDKQQNI